MRKLIWFILLSFVFLQLGFRVVEYWPRYTQDLSGEYWKDRYLQSQWVVTDSKNTIGDDGLYAYHGYELVRGGDPTIINPEVPPLGKYLIGLCVLLFRNNNIFGLFTGLFCLGAFYLFNRQLFKDRMLAFIPVGLFSFDALFYTQLQASFLDTLYLSFLFLTFLFFLRKKFFLAMIMLGCFASVKFSALAVFVIATCLVYLLLQKRRDDLIHFIPSIVMVPVVILLGYSRYFLLGHSLIDFLKVEKYIVVFYAIGAKARVFGMAIPMLLINRWYTWWDGVLRIPEWTVFWPVSLMAGFYTGFILKAKSPLFLCLLWSIAYLIFLSLTPVYPRYLLLLLPFLYNLFIWVLSQNTKVKSFFRLVS